VQVRRNPDESQKGWTAYSDEKQIACENVRTGMQIVLSSSSNLIQATETPPGRNVLFDRDVWAMRCAEACRSWFSLRGRGIQWRIRLCHQGRATLV
jgi:hypothetical protein